MRIGAPLPIKFFDAPKEGRRATPVNLSFPDDDGKTADFSLIQFQGEQCRIQTLFADNSANDIALTIQTNTVMQVITVPPKSQGYFPVLSTQPLKLTILSSGSTSVANIFALNFSVPPACWGIASGSGTASHVIVDSGTIDVSNFPAVQPVSQSGVWTIDAAQSGAWSLDINNFPASFGASQVGAWNVAITGTPNVNAAQSGAWNVGITGTPSVNALQSGAWNVNASQSGAWNVGITGTPSVNALQSGAWNVGITGTPNVNSNVTNFPANFGNSYFTQALAVHAFTSNGTLSALSPSRQNVTTFQICANNLVNTVAGTVTVKDGSGATILQKIVPAFTSQFSGTIFDLGNVALALNQAGSSGSILLTSTNITSGFLEIVYGAI